MKIENGQEENLLVLFLYVNNLIFKLFFELIFKKIF